jgi:adenylate cyclase
MQAAYDIGHPLTLAYMLGSAGLGALAGGQADALQRTAEQLTAVAEEHGLPNWLAWGRVFEGCVLVMRGERAAGAEFLRDGAARARAVGFEAMRPFFLAVLAEALGDVPEAHAALDEAFAFLERTGERIAEPELHRVRGLLTGDERELRTAVAIARRRGAVLLAQRAEAALAAV